MTCSVFFEILKKCFLHFRKTLLQVNPEFWTCPDSDKIAVRQLLWNMKSKSCIFVDAINLK